MATQPQPLFYLGSDNLQIMSATDIANIVDQVIALYAASQSVTLNVDTEANLISGGNTIIDGLPFADTRLTSGASSVGGSSFPTEATTEEPQTLTTNFNQIGHITASVTQPVGPLPLYRRTDGDIQAMSSTDFLDTFIRPAITYLTNSDTTTRQGGTYRAHTATSLAGHTQVGSTTIFSDTRADVSEFLADSIGTAGSILDKPETIQNYYLMRITPASTSTTIRCPAFLRSDNDIQAYSLTEWNNLLQGYVRWATTQSTGDRIKYQVATSAPSGGVQRGTSLTDTALTGGSGTYTTLKPGSNDYRAQEFPDGTPATITTYGFYIVRY